MPTPNRIEDESAETLTLLRQIAERLGHGADPPDDPALADRWQRPLTWHVVHLSDSLHTLRNSMQVLIRIIERLGGKVDQNASISRANAAELGEIRAYAVRLEDSAARIESAVGSVVPDKPLLMRDIVWLDTNPTEIWLILYTAGEAMVFLIGSDVLIRSAMFNAMSTLSSSNYVWGLACGVLSLGSMAAFVSRTAWLRRGAAFANTIYFLTSGLLTLLLAGGVLGWLPHLLAGASALWVLARGPSRAT